MITPNWWHTHGNKMDICKRESSRNRLVIKGSVAELRIIKTEDKGEFFCIIKWRITNFYLLVEVSGKVYMPLEEVSSAFGLIENIPPRYKNDYLIRKYGGTAAYQGHFIRLDDCLNIPGPGTALDGDQNISIWLTP